MTVDKERGGRKRRREMSFEEKWNEHLEVSTIVS